MTEFLGALLNQSFLQYALLGGLLASIGCGVVGSYVVVKRIGLLAGGIAHAVLGGMGVSYFLGHSPLAGALVAAIVASLIIGWVRLRLRENEDTVIAAVWAVGMAIGIMFISRTPGYAVDLMSYLFGNILLINRGDLVFLLVLDVIIVLVATVFHKQLLAVAFDEEFARLRGVPVEFFYLLLLVMVALTVVLLIRVVGLILVIALLTLPAAIARRLTDSLTRMMFYASGLGMLFTSLGLALSYGPDLPAGATIIVVAGVAYLVALALPGGGQR